MTATPPTMANGQPNPTGTGPYCAPNRCYCGDCPGYAAQVAAAERQYQDELRKIRNHQPRIKWKKQ